MRIVATLVLMALGGCASLGPSGGQNGRVGAAIAGWSKSSRLTAASLIEKYGAPDEILDNQLTWNDKGSWKRTRAWNVQSYATIGIDEDDIEQTVVYPVPAEKRAELAEFSGKINVSDNGLELTARSNSEAVNFLLVNLASEVIRGLKEPAAAREFYETTMQKSAAGKSSPYMRGMLFPRWESPGGD